MLTDFLCIIRTKTLPKITNNYMKEAEYKYSYPIKAIKYGEIEINVRKMRPDEMPDNGITYYCDENATIYAEGEKDFELLTNIK